MNVRFDYRPLPIHEPFHRSTARERSVFGGYGSGKSFALCAEAIAFGLEQPGSEILICRKTVPSLRDTTESIFTGMIPEDLWRKCDTRRMGNHYESIQFPNGTKYMFRGLDNWEKLKSLSLAGMFFDEADEIDAETYEGLLSRLRQAVPTVEAKRQGFTEIKRNIVCSASNPAGHNWLWERFVSDKTKAPNTEWFKSTSLDNPHLRMDYLESLLAMPEPWVRRYVLCTFDEFGGQIYQDWGWDTHVIRPYTEYPRDALFLMGMDPGTRDPTAALWCYYDKEKHCLVGIAEYQENDLAATVHANAWRKIEAKHRMKVRQRYADPNAINVRDRGTNMALSDQYRRLGFNFQLGASRNDDRIPALGQLIHLGRFKVTSDCPQTYERIKDYRWQDLTPQQRTKGVDAPEKPLKKNTHLVDCAQYICSRYVPPPKIALNRSDGEQWADEVRTAIRRQITNRSAKYAHDLGSVPV